VVNWQRNRSSRLIVLWISVQQFLFFYGPAGLKNRESFQTKICNNLQKHQLIYNCVIATVV